MLNHIRTRQIVQSLLYASILTLVSSLPGLPLSYYSNFVIEARHGFNKSTVGLWITDQLKGYLLGAAIGLPVLAGFLKVIEWSGDWFIPALMLFLWVSFSPGFVDNNRH